MTRVHPHSDQYGSEDDFEAEIDPVVAELREQLTDDDWAEIDRWLNTEIDPELANAIDAEIEAFFDSGRLTDLPPFGGDVDSADGDLDSDCGPLRELCLGAQCDGDANHQGGELKNSASDLDVTAGVPYLPDVTGMSNAEAAMAYAEAGIHVVPVRPGTKHPGSYVGECWPDQATRDLDTIRQWVDMVAGCGDCDARRRQPVACDRR